MPTLGTFWRTKQKVAVLGVREEITEYSKKSQTRGHENAARTCSMTTFAVFVAAAALAVEAHRACGSLRKKTNKPDAEKREQINRKSVCGAKQKREEAHMLCTRRANIVSMARVCRAEKQRRVQSVDSGFLSRRARSPTTTGHSLCTRACPWRKHPRLASCPPGRRIKMPRILAINSRRTAFFSASCSACCRPRRGIRSRTTWYARVLTNVAQPQCSFTTPSSFSFECQ